MNNTLPVFVLIGSTLLLQGCGSSGSDASSSDPNMNISLPFYATAGDQEIRCSESISGLGNAAGGAGTDVTVSDFRVFIHDVQLITDQGLKLPVELDTTQTSQNADVVLLDFRDTADIDDLSTEICPQTFSEKTVMNPGYNDTINGVAKVDAAYTLSAIQFTLGVPFGLNHNDQADAVEPLRNPGLASGMAWNWQAGYKFARFDVSPSGGISRPLDDQWSSTKWNIHLGSTGCSVSRDELVEGVEPKKCIAENRPIITLPLEGYDLNNIAIQLDYAALVSMNNLTEDHANSPGCMSGASDPECEALFGKLGLSWGENEAVEQDVFSVVERLEN